MKKIAFRYLLSLSFLLSYLLAFSQNVGIGTTAPVGKLHVKGATDISQLVIDANGTQSNTHPLFKLRSSNMADLLWIHTDDSTNVFVGFKSGRVNVIGPQGVNNTFIGSQSGYANTNGRDNTALGTNAMYSNTKASWNTAVGTNALFSQSFSTNGAWWQSNNVAVGYEALYSNQPTNTANGVDNTAIGTFSLRSNTTGSSNTASGIYSLYQNTMGSANTANGYWALGNNTTAGQNTAVGMNALFSQSFDFGGETWESNNVAIGYKALFANQPTSRFNGVSNTAVGTFAMQSNTIGYFNTSLGFEALFANTTGYKCTAIGFQALHSNSTGIVNTALGSGALYSNIGGSENTAVGQLALYLNTSGATNTSIGNESLSSNTSGNFNTSVGGLSLQHNVTGHHNIAIGYACGTSSGAPNFTNTVSIGNIGYLNGASNQAFLGNLSTLWNGGNQTWSTFSDARIKVHVEEDVKGLGFISRLRPVTYYRSIDAAIAITGDQPTDDYPEKYDVEKIKLSGFLAQDVEVAAREAGYDFSGITIPKNSTELYTLSYEQFVVPLVKAVQEQQAMIDELRMVNSDLLSRIELLESRKE